ncbi:putative FtsX-related transmembrane transport protein [Pedobacter sp. BAL39]|uniref:ABC transporter permease n=1 Tax=Pedobacter sp. BAL39 TaxID=391596 RepID=UPI0001559494|nr:ABC transporter permease [Pedobacter sp. BAL39]EDM38539.1 putative FtsX-related transmembrane transport protein [Pedobacter sp. BAL39]
MFKLNLKIALRSLWKNKSYTFINVGGLAIGLASCMILLLYVAYEWSFDRQFKDAEKTYVIYNNTSVGGQTFSWAWTPGRMAAEIREKIPGIAHVSHSSYPQEKLLSNGQTRLKGHAVFADPDFLRILDYKFLKGNPEGVLKNVNAIVLTESAARSLFGNEEPIGKSLKMENDDLLQVAAIMEDIPKTSSIRFDYLMSWELYVKKNPWTKEAGWGSNFCLTMLQLQDHKRELAVRREIKGIYHRNQPGNTNFAEIHPLTKWHLYGNFENGKSVGGKIDQVRIFFILAFCILLIACVNFMNLSTARSEKRAKEVGVRKAIGSSRGALVSQFMLESILITTMGMMLGFTLMELSLPYFNRLLEIELIINYGDWRFWTALVVLTLLTGVLAGSYPAFYLSSFQPVKVLKGVATKGSSFVLVRKVLVIFQFSFAACLIICTAVIYDQLSFVRNKPIGYQNAGLVELPVQGNLRSMSELNLLKDQILKSGAAIDVSFFSDRLNEGGNNTFGVEWPGKGGKEDVLFNNRSAGDDFVKTIGGKMVAGREFTSDYQDSMKVIVNEAGIKAMGMKDPIGKMISWDEERYTIVGVMKDFVMESAYRNPSPMFIAYNEEAFQRVVLRLNPAMNLTEALGKIDKIVTALNPEFPVDRVFVDERFEEKFRDEKLLGTLSNWFGGFAIFISCLGLLGLALFVAEQRKKEISIRKVLGASTANILALLNADFIKLVLIANLVSFPIAYIIIQRWLSNYEFRVGLTALPFLAAIAMSVVVAVLTVSVQSVRVAKANPIDALKHE